MIKNQTMGLLFPNMGDGMLKDITNVRSIGEYAFEANSLGKYDSNRHYVIPETV